MMRKIIPAFGMVLLLALSAPIILAESSVQIFFVACPNQAVVNLSGNMDAGWDVYYQVFSGADATGSTLTSLRQAQVSGAYAFSEAIPYANSQTVAAAATASVKVFVAREGNPTAVSAGNTFTVNDIQDGCQNPQNALATSVDAGSGATSTTTTSGSNILSPFGGVINPGVTVTPEPIVVIGARTQIDANRSATPGIIFAECDKFLPQAAPGVLYDNDNIVIFWSWFAKTEQQVLDHLAQSVYDVKLNTAPLIDVVISPIQKIGRNYWVFYSANVGRLRPGGYGVEFKLSWKQAISDGYDDFGPETDNPTQNSTCTFKIDLNPNNEHVTNYNQIYSVRN